MYSQNNEEFVIRKYFSNVKSGSILDIGANDGKTLSNSLALIESGWSAVLVEPAPIPFEKAEALHKDNPKVKCINLAIGNETGRAKFYSSGPHLKNGDTDLLSTLSESELDRWAGTDNTFTETEVNVVTFEQLMSDLENPTFDLILIDAEGLDYDILSQIDLAKVSCKMLVVETNSKDDDKYLNYCRPYGFKVLHKTYENLILVKNFEN